jgi:Tol biopolymer transport system component
MTTWPAAIRAAAISLVLAGCSAAPAGTASPTVGSPTPVAVSTPPPSGSPSANLGASAVPLGDTRWILYQRLTGAGGGIFLMHPDGTDRHEIAAEVAGLHKHPDWSPDGTQVVFVVDDDNTIWVVGADGSDPHRLDICHGGCDNPAWSPDGSRIAFSEFENVHGVVGPGAVSIDVVDLSTMKVTRVVRAERPLLDDVPRWSPDGTKIVFGIDRMDDEAFETGAAVGVVDATGGKPRMLTSFEAFAYAPDWGPTSDTIVYSRDILEAQKAMTPDQGTWDLFIVPSSGGEATQLTHLAPGKRLRHASWARDGSVILAAYEDPAIGVFVNPRTGAVTEFGGELVAHPRLRP